MRFNVVAFLDDVPLGAEFMPGDQPLHVTLIPPATTDADSGQVEAAIEHALADFGPIAAEGGDDELFGADRDIQVTLVEDDGSLMRLHLALLRALRPLSVRVGIPEHLGAGYRPHVTVRDDGRIERGEPFDLDAVALLTRDDGPWEVAAQFPLI